MSAGGAARSSRKFFGNDFGEITPLVAVLGLVGTAVVGRLVYKAMEPSGDRIKGSHTTDKGYPSLAGNTGTTTTKETPPTRKAELEPHQKFGETTNQHSANK
eukprot:TRINITY_DN317_c0_g1_i1.p2 TRINITY_DN317_c0_g1~~TRINITY_DN317_c0_g1_i1.p2  ORF type:complete len:102 (-),score=37.20 TRINITY_DN317_c0_g1_i1:102-407(-)